ncbi:MAG: hypothetical protein RI575_09865 [Balneolaceae bacterium]|nr:hypothetical protein [Balneolaceae bacterium]MDR9409843.1 hypothetical protein [Balneolaceae bacterium]
MNSGMYERLIQEAKESNEGLPAEELAQFFSRNLTISSTAEEPIKSRLIILFMDGKGNIINRYGLDAEELSNRRMRLGRLLSSSQIAGIMRESVPSSKWIPGTEWLSDNAPLRNTDEVERVARQMAIKIGSPARNDEFRNSHSLAFVVAPPEIVAPSENEFDKPTLYFAVFSLYTK